MYCVGIDFINQGKSEIKVQIDTACGRLVRYCIHNIMQYKWYLYSRTDDNLFMLERMIEMAKVRKECLLVDFIDMEKAYHRVNRKKLFEVMRGYGVQENFVDVIERIYDGSIVKFELESIMTGWCKNDSGVRQECPLSPLLFNIYVRELGMEVAHCKHGFE